MEKIYSALFFGTFLSLYFPHVARSPCCTLCCTVLQVLCLHSVFCFFHDTTSCCTLFMLQIFCVKLFLLIFSCSTLFMLYCLNVALLPCSTLFMLCFFLLFKFSSCCTFHFSLFSCHTLLINC